MLPVLLIGVGKLKEKYWVDEKQGEKRLYCKSGLIYSIEIVNGSIDTPVLLSAVEMIF